MGSGFGLRGWRGGEVWGGRESGTKANLGKDKRVAGLEPAVTAASRGHESGVYRVVIISSLSVQHGFPTPSSQSCALGVCLVQYTENPKGGKYC